MNTNLDQGAILARYSSGKASAMEARGALGDITFGELLIKMGGAGLPLPSPPRQEREQVVRKLRDVLFPKP